VRMAVAGFPSERDVVRSTFTDLVAATEHSLIDADVRLLCLHQCVEGATVGPANYMFTTAADVIRGDDLPTGFAAVLSGHIHRHQVLTTSLRGRALPAPVMYPGSIERTSIAEADEEKGFMIVELRCGDDQVMVDWQFHNLPARPLVRHDLQLEGLDADGVELAIRSVVANAPADAVVSVRLTGNITESVSRVLSASFLRSLTPATMNLDLRLTDGTQSTSRPKITRQSGEVLELPL
jgi:DNA repair exonuclease SbcCD nuclease subunit